MRWNKITYGTKNSLYVETNRIKANKPLKMFFKHLKVLTYLSTNLICLSSKTKNFLIDEYLKNNKINK